MGALRPRPVQQVEQAALAPTQWRLARGRRWRAQPVEQRGRVGVATEADAELFVQRVEERHLLGLVAFDKGVSEAVEVRRGRGRGDAPQQVDAPDDLLDRTPGQGGLAGRDGGVDVQEPGPVDGRRRLLERGGDRLVAGGRRRRPLGVELRQVFTHLVKHAGSRIVAERFEVGDQGVEGRRAVMATARLGTSTWAATKRST